MGSSSCPPSRKLPSQYAAAFALTLLLTACGGGSTPASDAGDASTPVVQKGFGPSQLYHPDTNPTGRVLQVGDTGIVFVGQALNAAPIPAGQGQQQVWFEIASTSTYTFEMEDEDLAILARVDVADAAGRALLSVDANQRIASAALIPGRYALRLIASPSNPETMPLFIRFEDNPAPLDQQGEADKPVVRANFIHTLQTVFLRNCSGCDLSGANLTLTILHRANLSRADLRGASLSRANLGDADLSDANLRGASLHGTNLHGANLAGANLAGANLNEANLYRANLVRANLMGANLYDAKNLHEANLYQADLRGALWVDGRRCAPNSFGVCR